MPARCLAAAWHIESLYRSRTYANRDRCALAKTDKVLRRERRLIEQRMYPDICRSVGSQGGQTYQWYRTSSLSAIESLFGFLLQTWCRTHIFQVAQRG